MCKKSKIYLQLTYLTNLLQKRFDLSLVKMKTGLTDTKMSERRKHYNRFMSGNHSTQSNVSILGVEDMKVEYRDNIALSTFGHNTGISQRLTKELSDIRKALGK